MNISIILMLEAYTNGVIINVNTIKDFVKCSNTDAAYMLGFTDFRPPGEGRHNMLRTITVGLNHTHNYRDTLQSSCSYLLPSFEGLVSASILPSV